MSVDRLENSRCKKSVDNWQLIWLAAGILLFMMGVVVGDTHFTIGFFLILVSGFWYIDDVWFGSISLDYVSVRFFNLRATSDAMMTASAPSIKILSPLGKPKGDVTQ